jgi:D-apionolactonase
MSSSASLSETLLTWGLAAPEPEPRPLQAGPVVVDYHHGVLRTLRVDGREAVRMINFAVRDQDWNTVPYEVLEEQVRGDPTGFVVQCRVRFAAGPIAYEAQVQWLGDSSGTVTGTFEGVATSDFQRNRIGFTVLHPLDGCVGEPVWVRHPDGTEEAGSFPSRISPHQPFFDVAAMRWRLDGRELSLQFEGDVFEMEDQRNWTDASFKTYCTPLGRPFPVPVRAGDTVSQRVVFRVAGAEPAPVPRVETPASAPEVVDLKRAAPVRLPVLGVAQSSEHEVLTPLECARLQALALSHYRVQLDLTRPDWPRHWERSEREGQSLELPLELVVWATAASDFAALAARLERTATPLRHLLLLSRDAKVSTVELLAKALPVLRERLPTLPLGAGTDAFFAELNRHRPPVTNLDFLSFSINPQVHAFDRLSLAENVEAQADAVESARAFAGGSAIHVSPVTLRMRWNPNATSTVAAPAEAVPGDLDTRQLASLGAAWTLGSVIVLATAGAAAVTYYETTGTRGLMQGAASRHAAAFPAPAGMVYPTYLVFHELAGYRELERLTRDSRVSAALLRPVAAEARVLLANLTTTAVRVRLPAGFEPTRARGLAAPFRSHCDDLGKHFSSSAWPVAAELELPPFGFISLDGRMAE